MDIYQRLTKDHRKHAEMAAQLLATHGDSAERRELFTTFRVELEAHANAEDQTLYSTMLANPDSAEAARHSVAEHKKMADDLSELAETDMATGAWLQKFKSLWHYIEHHEEEEERDVFPVGDEALPDRQERAMVGEFERRKAAEQEQL